MNQLDKMIGKEVQDRFNDLKGFVMGVAKYWGGCVQILFESKEIKDGKPVFSDWLDVTRFEIVGEGIAPPWSAQVTQLTDESNNRWYGAEKIGEELLSCPPTIRTCSSCGKEFESEKFKTCNSCRERKRANYSSYSCGPVSNSPTRHSPRN